MVTMACEKTNEKRRRKGKGVNSTVGLHSMNNVLSRFIPHLIGLNWLLIAGASAYQVFIFAIFYLWLCACSESKYGVPLQSSYSPALWAAMPCAIGASFLIELAGNHHKRRPFLAVYFAVFVVSSVVLCAYIFTNPPRLPR